MVPGTTEWQYVKVILTKPRRVQRLTANWISQSPGTPSAISVRVLLISSHSRTEVYFTGDAMAILSGGVLRSNLHRVV